MTQLEIICGSLQEELQFLDRQLRAVSRQSDLAVTLPMLLAV